jgi:hypothetical protein
VRCLYLNELNLPTNCRTNSDCIQFGCRSGEKSRRKLCCG